jgi:Inositol-pentakisphosphate 2-kinase
LFRRQETLLVNLIRKILTKDFTCCDKDFEVHSLFENDENVHLRDCKYESFSQLSRNCVLYSILKAQLLVRDNFFNMELLDKSNGTLANSLDEYRQILQDYRMGSTALDCSIMVTFKRINENFNIAR